MKIDGANDWWNWMVFWKGFHAGYGRAHLVALIAVLLAWPFADTSSATVFSVMSSYLFWSFGSLIYAYSAGEEEVREWRGKMAQTDD